MVTSPFRFFFGELGMLGELAELLLVVALVAAAVMLCWRMMSRRPAPRNPEAAASEEELLRQLLHQAEAMNRRIENLETILTEKK